MGDLAGGYVEMLKARNSARGRLMAWSERQSHAGTFAGVNGRL